MQTQRLHLPGSAPGFIWQQVFPEQLLLFEAYNKLLEENFPSLAVISAWRPITVNNGSVGRPAFDIPKETFKMFLNYGFSLIKISEMLGVSRKTVSRRIEQFGLLEEVPRYTNISNEDLDALVSEIYREFPNCGIRVLKGFLIVRGMRLQWERVRSSLWRINPEGIIENYATQFSKMTALFCTRSSFAVAPGR